jgi:hypothetical protein
MGEDADHLGSALDLAVQPRQWVGAADLGPMVPWEGHVGQDIRLGFIEQAGQLGEFGPRLIGDPAPLRLGRLGIVLGKGCAYEGANHGRPAPAAMGHDVSHEVHMKCTQQRCQVARRSLETAALMPSCASEM